MSGSRNRPTPEEWQARKDEIEKLYLGENATLDAVRNHLAEHDFHATIRQYKTKLKAWGFDAKKVRGEVWKAMYVVLTAQPRPYRDITFIVPRRGAEDKIITPDAILKQMKRNQAPDQSHHEAQQILDQHHVRSENLSTVDKPPLKSSHHARQSSATPLFTPSLTDIPLTSPSTLSLPDERQSQCSPFLPSVSRNTSHIRGRQSIPSIHNLLSTMHPTMSQTTRLSQVPKARVNTSVPTSGVVLHKTWSTADFDVVSALNQLYYDPSCDEAIKASLQQVLGRTNLLYHHGLFSEEKRLAAKWAAYYVLNGLPQYGNQTHDAHTNRQAAMSAFRQMLARHNRFIFPYCNWMLTVLASNDSVEMVREFLSDCCQIIDESANGQQCNYASPFHFALALYTQDDSAIRKYSHNIEDSNYTIGLIWGFDSPNYLINQYHFAWHKLDQKQFRDALEIVHGCLPYSKQVMGQQHTATINCLAMISRAYAEMGQTLEAIEYLKDALQRLTNSAEVLQAYRFRLLRRLALLQQGNGELSSAENNLRAVLEFRIAHFGINSEMTWSVINPLAQIMTMTGRHEEAEVFTKTMHDRFDQEMQLKRPDDHRCPAPWTCHTDHQSSTTSYRRGTSTSRSSSNLQPKV